MATPRVTIDELPEQTTLEDTNYFVIQDSGVSKKASWLTVKSSPSQALLDHINDPTGAHAATAISATAAGAGVDAADVQGQLGQLATLVDGKVSQAETDPLYVNVGGDTMTGALTLPGDPVNPLEAATKDYVDQAVIDAGGGITQADADLRYVNIDGDTMTGPLVVDALVSTNTGVELPPGEPSAAARAAPKSYVDSAIAAAMLAMWPVGSIYIGTTPTNPGTFIGGTWAAFGAGRTLFGHNAADASFDTAEETGGAKTVTLAEANLPAHDHTMAHTHTINHDHGNATAASGGAHQHTGDFIAITNPAAGASNYARREGDTTSVSFVTNANEGAHTHTVDIPAFSGSSGASSAANTGSTGSGTAIDKLPPYIVTYMWKRTA